MKQRRIAETGGAWTVTLALAAGVAAGLLAGALHLGGFARSDSPAAVARDPLARDTPASLAPSATSAAPALARPAPVDVPPQALVLAQALAEGPRIEVARGKGRIAGHVRTIDKRPLAGVLVSLHAQVDDRTGAALDEDDHAAKTPDEKLLAEVRGVIRRFRRTQALTREATTDAAGAYAFDDLGDGSYYASAELDGFEIRDAGSRGWIQAGATADFIAGVLVKVPIQVLLPSGEAPDHAEVYFAAPKDSKRKSWTPGASEVEVPPAEYRVSVFAGKEGEWRSDVQSVALVAGQAAPGLVFQLKGRLGIAGKIVLADAAELATDATFEVLALRSPGPGAPDVQRMRASGSSTWARGPDLSFALEDLKPGTYLVGVARPGGPLAASQVVEVADSRVALDLAVPPLDRGSSVRVVVLDPDGGPVEQVRLTCGLTTSQRLNQSALVSLRADGSRWLYLGPDVMQAWRGDGASRFTVRAECDDFGVRVVGVPRGDGAVTIQFARPAWLSVTVAGYGSGDLEGEAQIVLQRAPQAGVDDPSGGGSGGDGPVDEAGTAALGPLDPGDYDLQLYLRADGESRVIAEKRVHVVSGKNVVTVTPPALYSVGVRFPGAGYAGISGTGLGLRVGVAAGGAASFSALPAGLYSLTFQSSDGNESSGSMTISVPAGAEVVFAPRPEDSLLVTIRGSDGPSPASGLATGDFIVAIDGASLESRNQAFEALRVAARKEVAHVRVLRGEATLDMDVDLRPFVTPGSDANVDAAPRPR